MSSCYNTQTLFMGPRLNVPVPWMGRNPSRAHVCHSLGWVGLEGPYGLLLSAAIISSKTSCCKETLVCRPNFQHVVLDYGSLSCHLGLLFCTGEVTWIIWSYLGHLFWPQIVLYKVIPRECPPPRVQPPPELQNWCFQNVVLEKILESPLDCKEIKPVNPKESQSWIFIGRTDAEAPILWPPDAKSRLIRKDPDAGKDWRQEEKGMTEDEMVGWHHRLNGHEFEQAPGDGEGQGSLACCSPWGRKESDTTEWLKNGRASAVLTSQDATCCCPAREASPEAEGTGHHCPLRKLLLLFW